MGTGCSLWEAVDGVEQLPNGEITGILVAAQPTLGTGCGKPLTASNSDGVTYSVNERASANTTASGLSSIDSHLEREVGRVRG